MTRQSLTTLNGSKLTANELNAVAQRYIDDGDVEYGWYLRGAADFLRGAQDAIALHDELYGDDYRSGWGDADAGQVEV